MFHMSCVVTTDDVNPYCDHIYNLLLNYGCVVVASLALQQQSPYGSVLGLLAITWLSGTVIPTSCGFAVPSPSTAAEEVPITVSFSEEASEAPEKPEQNTINNPQANGSDGFLGRLRKLLYSGPQSIHRFISLQVEEGRVWCSQLGRQPPLERKGVAENTSSQTPPGSGHLWWLFLELIIEQD